MTHNRQHIEHHHAGDAHAFPLKVYDTAGDVMDVSGADVEWYLKEERTQEDGSALLEKTTDSGGVNITNGSLGELEVKINTGETDGLLGSNEESGSYEHVCRVEVDGDRGTVVHGSFQIEQY